MSNTSSYNDNDNQIYQLVLTPQTHVVNDMGNLWVKFTLSVPVSVCTHTHDTWVWILTGFCMGMGKGKLPKDKGTGFRNNNKSLQALYTSNYAIISHSSTNQVSPSLTSGKVATAFKSSKLTKPILLQ